MTKRRPVHVVRTALAGCGLAVALAACGSADPQVDASEPATTEAPTETTTTEEPSNDDEAVAVEAIDSDDDASSEAEDVAAPADPAACEATAALFVTRGSANPDLDDPIVSGTCLGETIEVYTNAIPDYTYIGTSPGFPGGRDFTYTIPASPTTADETTAIPYIGELGVTLSGIPIYGPTEGTGGDVDSLPGIVSACGSHNGPGGFHTHKILASEETDCFFTPEEVAAEPQLAGYALDGYPIYTGIDQYTSSWELTDESLFASDTWAAHTYVAGSGDLDECNGLTDADGNYAYYTTEEFPYVLGCFAGEVEIVTPEPPADGEEGEERPERPEDEERPEPPVDGEEGEERPEPPAEGEDAP